MKKLKRALKRTWRLWTPGKAAKRVHNDIKRTLEKNNIRYSVISPSNDIEFRFQNDNELIYSQYISFESKSELKCYISFGLQLTENAYDRICHLSQLFNDRLRHCTLRIHMEEKSMTLYGSIPMEHCHLNGETLDEVFYAYDRYANDILWAFHRLLSSDEEAVFVFAELVERINAK